MNIFYDQHADINLLKNKQIAVIGYGSQGFAQANNLKDSGCKVIIGLREDSLSKAKAEQAAALSLNRTLRPVVQHARQTLRFHT